MTDVQDTLVASNYKVCHKCKEGKPFSEFHKWKSGKYGLAGKCKKCSIVAAAEWRINNKDKYSLYCKENRERFILKARERRKANPEKAAEYYLKNKDKCRQASEQWRKNNKEKVNAISATRRARKRKAEGRFSEIDINYLMGIQKWKCICCKADIKNNHHVDHIIPLAKGGSNDRRNLQLLCPTCNWKKGAKHPIDFMQSIGMLL